MSRGTRVPEMSILGMRNEHTEGLTGKCSVLSLIKLFGIMTRRIQRRKRKRRR